MKNPKLDELYVSIKRHIDECKRLNGVVSKFGLETTPLATKHMLDMLMGWNKRLQWSAWNVVEIVSELIQELAINSSNFKAGTEPPIVLPTKVFGRPEGNEGRIPSPDEYMERR